MKADEKDKVREDQGLREDLGLSVATQKLSERYFSDAFGGRALHSQKQLMSMCLHSTSRTLVRRAFIGSLVCLQAHMIEPSISMICTSVITNTFLHILQMSV